MKKILLLAVVSLTALSAANADAVELSPYVGVKAGLSMLHNEAGGYPDQDRNVLFGSVSAGVDFLTYNPDMPYSFELEYTYRPEFKKAHSAGTDVKSQNISYMLNGYYDFVLQNPIRPYVSAGLGWTRNHRQVRYLSGAEIDKTAYDLTWSLGAGVRLPDVSYNTDAVFGYRYVDFGTMKTGTNVDMYAHELYAGLNYKF